MWWHSEWGIRRTLTFSCYFQSSRHMYTPSLSQCGTSPQKASWGTAACLPPGVAPMPAQAGGGLPLKWVLAELRSETGAPAADLIPPPRGGPPCQSCPSG